MHKSLQVACSFLPPPLIDVMRVNGFAALRIEGSGALRLTISNELPVERKSTAVVALRKALKEYGLDLNRSMGDVSSRSARDESCLVVKRDGFGEVVPLFMSSGEPYPEMPALPDELLAGSSAKTTERSASNCKSN